MLTLDHQASDGRGRSEPVMGRIAGVVLGHANIVLHRMCVHACMDVSRPF